jgi:hypothetical protein
MLSHNMSFYYKTNNLENLKCRTCGGIGTIEHKICHGTGNIKNDNLGTWNQSKCTGCNGTGIVQCSSCGGTGQEGRY